MGFSFFQAIRVSACSRHGQKGNCTRRSRRFAARQTRMANVRIVNWSGASGYKQGVALTDHALRYQRHLRPRSQSLPSSIVCISP